MTSSWKPPLALANNDQHLALVYLAGFSTGEDWSKQHPAAFGAFLLGGALLGLGALLGFQFLRYIVSIVIGRVRSRNPSE